MKKQLLKFAMICVVAMGSLKTTAQTISSFESLTLAPGSVWDGSVHPSGTSFSDGNATFPNFYDPSFGVIRVFLNSAFAHFAPIIKQNRCSKNKK